MKMPPTLPPELASIDALIEAGDYEAAGEALEGVTQDLCAEVLRIKLELYDGTVVPPLAMQRLIQIMRKDANVLGGKELYQEASNRAYQDRQSSVSHSHPPPPVTTKDPKEEE
jgi:hypothetical protein